MTPQTVASKQKLEVAWTESAPFEVNCKQLTAGEPRVLHKFTIAITLDTADSFPTSLAS